ncbi:MAG: discoidin domain-containing protein [Saprospiraceae bacterium]
MVFRIKLIFVLIAFSNVLIGQARFTPYDDLPGVQKSFKPNPDTNMPDWAKLLYQYPINYNEIYTAFNSYTRENPGVKNAFTRYFKHWSRIIASITDVQGNIIMPSVEQIQVYNNTSGSRQEHSTSLQQRKESSWQFLGPKVTHWLKEDDSNNIPDACPWQVNIYNLSISPSHPDILYCGTETGTINVSTDGGNNWSLKTQNYFAGGGISSLVVHPRNPEIAYAGAGNKIHITTDMGQTWTSKLQNEYFDANTLIINENGQQLIAASDKGIYITNDESITWTKSLSENTFDVEYKPDDQGIIYALTSVDGVFQFHISLDGGDHFNKVNNFPANIQEISGGVLAVTPANPNIVMMTLLSSDYIPIILMGVFENNETWTWSEIARGGTQQLGMDNGQGYYDLDMEISPDDENAFVVATTTMYKTSDGGLSFTAVGGYKGNFPIHPDIQDIEFSTDGKLWVATDGGLTVTTDFFNFQSNFFVKTNGIVGSDFWGFDQGWNEDIVVGGRYHNGNTAISEFYNNKAIRMGGAESPTGWVIQGKSRHVAFNDLGGGWILPKEASSKYDGRFVFSKFPNMDEYGGRRGSLLHHPYYSNTLYLGENNAIWQSKDAGMTWELLYQFDNRVMSMQIGYQEPDILYADVRGKGLYRSNDGGISWRIKPSLTSAPNASTYWSGKMSLAISPYNADVIYVCLQNGTWSSDKGKVFKSTDGGDTWTNITYGLDVYMKSVIVQPSNEDSDIVYLFCNARNNNQGEVLILEPNSQIWQSYHQQYPSGMQLNHAIPFYRENKIRAAGNMGVWEAELYNTEYKPIIRPWAEYAIVSCNTDTVQMEDHSIIAHEGATWEWDIQPKPTYISSTSSRNPKVVFGQSGVYSITMRIFKNGKTFEKTIPNMITVKPCPSLETCNNPTTVPKESWVVTDFDSQEIHYPGYASMAIDGDINTIWHTRWATGADEYPHFLTIDLGQEYTMYQCTYTPRQDGSENGRIKEYELYLSTKEDDFGQPIKRGQFENTLAPSAIKFDEGITARYVKLVALSEVNENPWSSAAEIDFIGCYPEVSGIDELERFEFTAHPIPTEGQLHVSIPNGNYKIKIIHTNGSQILSNVYESRENTLSIDVANFSKGIYILSASNDGGTNYYLKFIKM